MTQTTDLAHFDFLSLLRMLAEGGKTGVLRVFRDHDEFDCWLEDGRVRRLQLGASGGIDALSTLLQEARGRFQFDEGERHPEPQLNASLDEVALAATAALPLLPLPFGGPARLTSPERMEALEWTTAQQKVLRQIELQKPLFEVGATPEGHRLISQLLRLGLLRERRSRVARLTIGVTREVRGVALVDHHIFRRWKEDLVRPPQQLAIRDDAGRTYMFAVREGPGVGTQLLLPTDLIMQTALQAGDSVLVKPV